MSSILCNKSSFAGATKVQSSKRNVVRSPLVVRAQQESVDVVSLFNHLTMLNQMKNIDMTSVRSKSSDFLS